MAANLTQISDADTILLNYVIDLSPCHSPPYDVSSLLTSAPPTFEVIYSSLSTPLSVLSYRLTFIYILILAPE